ncbi:AAA family ATPase [Enterobacter chuandaensis]|uniref:AAA family ATPase n=1 Tax=Enterobacter chuandaensis TaxID=2497875 RepID=UPI00300CC51E
MLVIESLHLENFKAYKDQEFIFSYLTVFCGNNSVGKSTAIQAIGMFLQSNILSNDSLKISGDLVNIGSVDDIVNYENREMDSLSIRVCSPRFDVTWGYGGDSGKYRDELNNLNELPIITRGKDLSKLRSAFRKGLNFQFLEAERYGPRDNMPLVNHNYHNNWLGKQGENTIAVLEQLANKRIVYLSGNRRKKDPRRHSTINVNNVFNNIEAWMQEISPGYKIVPHVETSANVAFNSIITPSGQDTKPVNIGFGYTYALSIVSALILAKAGDLVVIENPEAHLHPRGQSYLGRLIALASEAKVQVIIETHSDHLLNGIRVISKIRKSFLPELFNLYYVSKNNNETEVAHIKLDNDGRLSEWPKGFFDQQSQDMYTLMTGSVQ